MSEGSTPARVVSEGTRGASAVVTSASKSERFRSTVDAGPLVRLAGAHNAIGARIAEAHGFDAVWVSGLEVSASRGVPDFSLLSMSDYLDAARVINDAVSIPVVADCDSGFGGVLNVAFMVESYERVGIAGVCIEDQIFPKVNSLVDHDHALIPTPDFVDKISIARRSRVSSDFFIIARTEALIAGLSVDEALGRAEAYADAGADAILIHSKERDPKQVREFAEAWKRETPLVAVPTTYPSLTAPDLERMGISVVIYANQGLRAAVRAMDDAFRVIARDGSTMGVEDQIASLQEIFELKDTARWLKLME